MEFESADSSVLKSITQRVLLNAWRRASRKPDALPLLSDFRTEDTTDERADMMGFEVVRHGDTERFLITQVGARLTAAYGNEHIDPAERINRYLDDAIGADRYARVVPPYRACLAHKRPTYTVSAVQDADGKEVAYERLLLPFGRGDTVEQLVGSCKAISIDGGFRLDNLMGTMPSAVPVVVISAVIDRAFAPAPRPSAQDIELI
ncbi:hypothetical protein ACFFWD_05305 [Bradyrhizobium erythrophlei]|uniref:hypothetical protein n=1 Tax=Bradyrhizobium erythrophlei TaxID=1437360 RepID=UPI0035EB70C1